LSHSPNLHSLCALVNCQRISACGVSISRAWISRHAASALSNEVTRSVADMDALLDELENTPAAAPAASSPVPRMMKPKAKSPSKVASGGSPGSRLSASRKPFSDLGPGRKRGGGGNSPRATQVHAATKSMSHQQPPHHGDSNGYGAYYSQQQQQQQSFASNSSFGTGSSASNPPVHFYYDATSRHAGFSRVPPPFSSETARQYFPDGILDQSASNKAVILDQSASNKSEGRHTDHGPAGAPPVATHSPSPGRRRNNSLPDFERPAQHLGMATTRRATGSRGPPSAQLNSSCGAARPRNDWEPSVFHNLQTPLEVLHLTLVSLLLLRQPVPLSFLFFP